MLKINNVGLTVNEKQILKNISFEVQRSDFLSVLGSNGAGKSSLAKLIARIWSSSEGSIFIDGKDSKLLKQSEIARMISYVPQNHYFFDKTSVSGFNFTQLFQSITRRGMAFNSFAANLPVKPPIFNCDHNP